jgi:hypothetical protein
MTTPVVRRRTEDSFFIHNCFGSFFKGVLDWFADSLYPRFEYKVIGTYDKAVEFFTKARQNSRELDTKITPSITLDPMYDFSNEERGGRFLWMHSQYAPGLGMRMWKGIDLKEQDVIVTPVFSRYQGTFEITFWLNSVYELLDFRTMLLQFCGGFNRWLRPEFFWTFLILPEQIENFENEEGVKLDWSNTYADLVHVDTINRHRLGVPIALDPIWKLDSFADSSTKYGADRIAEYKLTSSFTYEINLPTYVVLNHKVDPQLTLSLSLGSTYTKYPLVSPYRILSAMKKADKADRILGKNPHVFRIANKDKARENLLIDFGPNILKYPDKVVKWCPIVQGTLVHLTEERLNDPDFVVHKNYILFFDRYRDTYLPSLRRCAAVMCGADNKTSVFYSKCELLQKPCVTALEESDREKIPSYDMQEVTLDCVNGKLYSGFLAVEEAPETSSDMYKLLVDIKNDNPAEYEAAVKSFPQSERDLPEHKGTERVDKMVNRLLAEKTNGIQKRFYLDYTIDESSFRSLQVYIDDKFVHYNVEYTILENSIIEFFDPPPEGSSIYLGGEFLIIKESKLVGIYEFTEEDVTRTDPLVVPLPQKLNVDSDLAMVSYAGKMKLGIDYELNMTDQTVTILLEPIKEEIVEFFYYFEKDPPENPNS